MINMNKGDRYAVLHFQLKTAGMRTCPLKRNINLESEIHNLKCSGWSLITRPLLPF